jgi:hypothetical protein
MIDTSIRERTVPMRRFLRRVSVVSTYAVFLGPHSRMASCRRPSKVYHLDLAAADNADVPKQPGVTVAVSAVHRPIGADVEKWLARTFDPDQPCHAIRVRCDVTGDRGINGVQQFVHRAGLADDEFQDRVLVEEF